VSTAKLTTGKRRPVSRPSPPGSTLEVVENPNRVNPALLPSKAMDENSTTSIESREAEVPPKNELPSHSGHIQPRLSQPEEPLCLECRYHHTEEEDCIDWRDDPANFHPDSQGA